MYTCKLHSYSYDCIYMIVIIYVVFSFRQMTSWPLGIMRLMNYYYYYYNDAMQLTAS